MSYVNPKTGIISNESITSLREWIFKQKEDLINSLLNEDQLTEYINSIKDNLKID